MEQVKDAGRSRRADAGVTRVTERDLELLRWVGEQYAVSLPQLAVLMGRSEHAARWLRARWQREGWVEGRALLVGVPVFVWLTREGSRLAGLELKLWEPNAGALAHVAAVNEVRIFVERRRPQAVWVSERELARDQERAAGKRHGHRPDGLVVVDGRHVAVEVELTLKSRARLERIVRALLRDYDTVWYFAAPASRRALDEIAGRLESGRLHVAGLPAEGRA